MGYAPRTDPAEFLAVARLAAAAGAPTYTHVRELVEADPTTPDRRIQRRSRSPPPRPARRCTTATSTAPRGGTSTGCWNARRRAPPGSRVTVEAYPVRCGQHRDRRVLPRAGTLAAWGLPPVEHRRRRHRRAGRRRAAGCVNCAATTRATECIVEFLDESDPGDRAMLHASARLPGLDRRERRHAAGVAGRDPRHLPSGRCRRAARRTRAPRGRSRARCG